MEHRKQRLREAYNMFDLDQNGLLSEDELFEVYTELHEGWSREQHDELWRTITGKAGVMMDPGGVREVSDVDFLRYYTWEW